MQCTHIYIIRLSRTDSNFLFDGPFCLTFWRGKEFYCVIAKECLQNVVLIKLVKSASSSATSFATFICAGWSCVYTWLLVIFVRVWGYFMFIMLFCFILLLIFILVIVRFQGFWSFLAILLFCYSFIFTFLLGALLTLFFFLTIGFSVTSGIFLLTSSLKSIIKSQEYRFKKTKNLKHTYHLYLEEPYFKRSRSLSRSISRKRSFSRSRSLS